MVDFNNESTVAQTPANLLQILLIQKREYLLDAVEAYYKEKELGTEPSIGVVKGRAMNLFFAIRAMMFRRSSTKEKKESLELLEKKLGSDRISDMLEAFFLMEEFLDDLKVTTVDNRKSYDRTRVTEEDKVQGL